MKDNFLLNSNPNTNLESCVYFKDWRISILKENIIRLEKNNKKFNDLPTQIVINRYFDKVQYDVEETNVGISIKLANYTLVFNGDIDSSYILYNNEKILLNNNHNLGGTYSTVDGMDGERYVYQGEKGSIILF